MTARLHIALLGVLLLAGPVVADETEPTNTSGATAVQAGEGAIPLDIPEKEPAAPQTPPASTEEETPAEADAPEATVEREDSAPAAATQATRPEAAPEYSEAEERLAFIESALDERAEYAPWWKYGWMSFFGGATLVQLGGGLTGLLPPEGAYVGAATAFLGTADMVISPVDGGSSAEEVRACRNESTDAAKVACAERVLHDTARGEAKGTSWQPYILSALVSTSAALVTVYYFDQPWLASKSKDVNFLGGGAFKIISGVLVSQLRIHSTPRGGREAWREYQNRYGTGGLEDEQVSWSLFLTDEVVGLNVQF